MKKYPIISKTTPISQLLEQLLKLPRQFGHLIQIASVPLCWFAELSIRKITDKSRQENYRWSKVDMISAPILTELTDFPPTLQHSGV